MVSMTTYTIPNWMNTPDLQTGRKFCAKDVHQHFVRIHPLVQSNGALDFWLMPDLFSEAGIKNATGELIALNDNGKLLFKPLVWNVVIHLDTALWNDGNWIKASKLMKAIQANSK